MVKFSRLIASLSLVLGIAVAFVSAESTEEFECPSGSYMTQISGTYSSSIHSIKARCNDAKNTESKAYGSNKGEKFELPVDKHGITKIVTNTGTFIDSIGYNGKSVGGPLGTSSVEYVDINGCAIVGFQVSYKDSLTKLRFKFACVNKPISVKGDVVLKDKLITPSTCDLCIAEMTVNPTTRITHMAKVLSHNHHRFINSANAYAVAYAIDKANAEGDAAAQEITRVLVGADTGKPSPAAGKISEFLSRGKYTGTKKDFTYFNLAGEIVGVRSTEFGDLIDRIASKNGTNGTLPEKPFCDEVMDKEGVPFCDAVYNKNVTQNIPFCDSVMDDKGTPFCDAVEKQQKRRHNKIPYCDAVMDDKGTPFCDAVEKQQKRRHGKIPYCDAVMDKEGIPFCDAVEKHNKKKHQKIPFCDSVMDDKGIPFCDAVEKYDKKHHDKLPFCNEVLDKDGTPFCDEIEKFIPKNGSKIDYGNPGDNKKRGGRKRIPFCDEVQDKNGITYCDIEELQPGYKENNGSDFEGEVILDIDHGDYSKHATKEVLLDISAGAEAEAKSDIGAIFEIEEPAPAQAVAEADAYANVRADAKGIIGIKIDKTGKSKLRWKILKEKLAKDCPIQVQQNQIKVEQNM